MNDPLTSFLVVYGIRKIANVFSTPVHKPPKKRSASPYESERLFALKKLGMTKYEQYLGSHYWKRVKWNVFSSRLPICFACGKFGTHKTLRVHHCDYSRLGHERNDDLILLCPSCHSATHAIEKRTHILKNAHLNLRSNRERAGLKSGPRYR